MVKQRKNKWFWMEEYRCGCTYEADRKSDLLGYCGIHGDDRNNLYKLPIKEKENL